MDSRCHLAGDRSLSRGNSPVGGVLSPHPCLEKLHHSLTAPPLCPSPPLHGSLVSQGSQGPPWGLAQGAGQGQEMAPSKEDEKPVRVPVSGVRAVYVRYTSAPWTCPWQTRWFRRRCEFT